jgi:hypothetical protein
MKTVLCLLAALVAALPAGAHFEVTPFPKVVQPGLPMVALASSDPGSMVVYKVHVPAGAGQLTVITSGGSGQLRLYLRRGVQPTENGEDSDYRSVQPGTRHRIAVPDPAAGVWYVGLHAVGNYNGVQLRALTPLAKGAPGPPRFSPPPGVYPAPVECRITTRVKQASLRFTTGGEDPGATAPLAPAAISITDDTTLKARVFPSTGAAGPLAEATYRIRPPGDILDLAGTTAISHLAAAKGGRHLFRVTVADGERLGIHSEGGKGKSMISVSRGAIPPAGKPPKGSAVVRDTTRVTIPSTLAGDYYIALDATTSFAGRSLVLYVAGDGADLMPWAAALAPYVSVEEFSATSCEVEEGLIGAGVRRLIRYNTEVRNLGARDLVMPSPEGNPFFEYHECHGHYHFRGFASSRLLDRDGNVLRTGNKVSFCLLDGKRWRSDAPARRRYNCEVQGIQAGWSDIYDSGLPGQWIEIGDLPAGTYQLEVTVNPDGILAETNYANNVVAVPVIIPAE